MRRDTSVATCAIIATTLLVLSGSAVQSNGQAGALVRLQTSTPGVTQAGHINVGGTVRTGESVLTGNVFGFTQVSTSLPVGVAITSPVPEAIGLYTNGIERVRIAPNGAVGLGLTPANNARLHVLGPTYIDGGFGGGPEITFALGDTDTGLNWLADGQMDIMSNWGIAMRVRTQNVGFGVASPASRIDLSEDDVSKAGIRSYVHGGGPADTDPNGYFWRSGLEVAGRNGITAATITSVNGWAVGGITNTSLGLGVYGWQRYPSNSSNAILGENLSGFGYAVAAQGRFFASGTKAFRIDHPLDPYNKYLNHYCTEGPEPLNAYSGNVVTDHKGEAWVELPPYFAEINKDVRYSLTVVDADDTENFVMVKVAREIEYNRFKIRSSKPSVKVSWRVEATRHDRYIREYGAPIEQEKGDHERGRLQHPALYGREPEIGISPSQQGRAVK